MERIESRRGKRIRRTEAVIAKRLRFLKQFGPDTWYEFNAAESHRLSKKHPWDCGRSRCCICHFGKVFGIEKKKYKGNKVSGDYWRM